MQKSDISESTVRKMVYDHIIKNDLKKIKGEIFLFDKVILPFKVTRIDILYKQNESDVKEFSGISVNYKIVIDLQKTLGCGDKKQYIKNVIFDKLEYKTSLRDTKLKSLNITLSDKIKPKLDEYLEFDSSELFIPGALVRIFGGAIRDSIAGQEINDIDLLVGSKSLQYVEYVLESNGYSYIKQLTPKDLSSVYTDIKVINEPHSWIKGNKVVQIIRPATNMNIRRTSKSKPERFDREQFNEKVYTDSFKDLIRNVDISCCGVSYDGDNVYENYQDAVKHCKSGIFMVNKKAKMYSERRITHRVVKLEERGWKKVDPGTATNRDIKIDMILDKEKLDYVLEWSSDTYYGDKLPDGDFDDLFII